MNNSLLFFCVRDETARDENVLLTLRGTHTHTQTHKEGESEREQERQVTLTQLAHYHRDKSAQV